MVYIYSLREEETNVLLIIFCFILVRNLNPPSSLFTSLHLSSHPVSLPPTQKKNLAFNLKITKRGWMSLCFLPRSVKQFLTTTSHPPDTLQHPLNVWKSQLSCSASEKVSDQSEKNNKWTSVWNFPPKWPFRLQMLFLFFSFSPESFDLLLITVNDTQPC